MNFHHEFLETPCNKNCKWCKGKILPQCRDNNYRDVTNYFLAKLIFMAVVGVILNPWRASLAAADCISFSNSTNAMSERPGTSLTSLNPGNWLNSMLSIISLVSAGRLVRKRIWLGGALSTPP